MVMFECAPPFQWKPTRTAFGDFRRLMWGWFAVTWCPHDINDLIEGVAKAGVAVYGPKEGQERKP